MYYFAYGMNTNLDQMAQRAPRAKCMGAARLPYYRFRFAYHADIVPDRASSVWGVLWRVTPDCRRALDTLEGYPDYYNVCEVDVVQNGQVYVAEAYYMNPGHEDDFPSDSYLNMVMEGYRQNSVNTGQIVAALQQLDSNFEFVDRFAI